MTLPDKYSRIERERRFLLSPMGKEVSALPRRVIVDHYIVGTDLRLRQVENEDNKVFKLTKKSKLSPGHEQITTIYLSSEEYKLLSKLPAIVVSKSRHITNYEDVTIGIDIYGSGTEELWLAEVEFENTASMDSFIMPLPYQSEVTGVDEFSGFALANRFGFLNRVEKN